MRDFHDWRGNPINAAAFEEIQWEWNGTIAILHHENRIARAAEALRRRRGVAPWPIASQYDLAIGIVVILGALALGAIWTRDRPQQVVTGKSDNRQIVLSDGSRIRLDRDSGLSVTDTARLRRLVLDRGEAVVETAADGPRPFDFRAGPADLTANGAKFVLRRGADGVHVTLVEGAAKLRLMPLGSTQSLVQGEEAVVTPTHIQSAAIVYGSGGDRLNPWSTRPANPTPAGGR